jgi:hypothetical protein
VELDRNAKRFDALQKLQGSLWERYGEMRLKKTISEEGLPDEAMCLLLDATQQEFLDAAMQVCTDK